MKKRSNVDSTQNITHISLCTGYGGIDIGLQRAIKSMRTVAYCEIEAFACANLVAKMEAGLMDVAPIWSNLKTFPWTEFHKKVDILSGGFPCQPFSSAGSRQGDEDPRHLWPHIVKGINELGRPPILFFENVEGILSSKLKGEYWTDPAGTPILLHILRELERMGYQATAGVFSASEVGATHQRKRLFILGTNLNTEGREFVYSQLQLENPNSNGNSEVSIFKPKQAIDYRGERVSSLFIRSSSSLYPAPRGHEQYSWEPPRVSLGNTKSLNESCSPGRRGSNKQELHLSNREPSSNDKSKLDNTHNNDDSRSKELRSARTHCDNATPRKNILLESSRASHSNDEQSIQRDFCTPSEVPSSDNLSNIRVSGTETNYSNNRSQVCDTLQEETKSSMGGSIDGFANWLDCAELYESCDSRVDELRLLGNGVVPDVAKIAFLSLWQELR